MQVDRTVAALLGREPRLFRTGGGGAGAVGRRSVDRVRRADRRRRAAVSRISAMPRPAARSASGQDAAALAAATGLPAESLADTLAEVDRLAAGRRHRHLRPAVRPPRGGSPPPYLAVKVTGALFHTQGGLAVDGDGRVLRAGRRRAAQPLCRRRGGLRAVGFGLRQRLPLGQRAADRGGLWPAGRPSGGPGPGGRRVRGRGDGVMIPAPPSRPPTRLDGRVALVTVRRPRNRRRRRGGAGAGRRGGGPGRPD